MARSCFVIMPFGEKPDDDGEPIDFDEIFEYVIRPPIEKMELECVRSDKIDAAGSIHRKMIRHVFEADVAVVDITTLNANVFYELGVRHALRPSVTVLIRKRGTQAPFNIQGLNVIEYDLGPKSVEEAKHKIEEFIRAGVQSAQSDSLVHDVLDIRIGTAPKLADRAEVDYRLVKVPEKGIRIVTGDIQSVKGVDLWVSSENTNMQMARFFDRAVSSVIRYFGAERNDLGHVVTDTIADDLAAQMGTEKTVPAATVIATTSGGLAASHGVKKLLHAAAVTGEVGEGYAPIANVARCVTNALQKADSPALAGLGATSILFPLLGTGTAGGDLQATVGRLLSAAVDYLEGNPASTIERVWFVAWREAELIACTSFLDNCDAVTRD
jgi:O-acetyl-ADP-ribose deacetylase (regulator of RNase III)